MKSTMAVMIVLAVLGVSACTSTRESANNFFNQQTMNQRSKTHYPKKNPRKVAFYTSQQEPQTAYKIIGTATVSKYNLFGLERNQELVKQQMKNIAADLGGDGLINYDDHKNNATANVIAFQKILI